MEDSTGHWPKWSQIFTVVAVAAIAVAAVAFTVATCGATAPALAAAGGVIIGGISAGTAAATAVATSVATVALVMAEIAATAAIVINVVENSSYRGPTRDQSVYVMRDKATNEVQYVGRTNNPARRQSEHAKDPKKANLQPMEIKFTGLTKVEARAMEQVLISAYSLDNLCNARREIAMGNIAGFAGKIGNVIRIFDSSCESEFLSLMGR